MYSQQEKPTITKYILHGIWVVLVLFKRNVLRIHGAGGAHRIELNGIRPRFERSESFRRRYNGKHFLRLWEPTWTY